MRVFSRLTCDRGHSVDCLSSLHFTHHRLLSSTAVSVVLECINKRRIRFMLEFNERQGKDQLRRDYLIHFRGRPRRSGPMKKNSIIYIFLSESHADKHADFLPRT
jgi:hypothetical protein